MTVAENPKTERERHLNRVDFLVKKFLALADGDERAALLADPLPRVEVVELKAGGFLWPGPA